MSAQTRNRRHDPLNYTVSKTTDF